MFKYLKFLCLFVFISLDASPPKLLIKIPTRARFNQFFSVLDSYYANLSGKIPYEFIITCDLNDPIMNSPTARNRFKNYPHLKVFYGTSSTKIEAFNSDIQTCDDFDIVLVGSDDMFPQIYGYDLEIVACIEKNFPDFDGVLHYNDGYTKDLLITYPILGRKYYDRFGYVFHPIYQGFYCDNELTDVSKMIGKYIYIDEVLFEHQHPANGKGNQDLLYELNNKSYYTDQVIYLERRKILFDLPRELILNPLQI